MHPQLRLSLIMPRIGKRDYFIQLLNMRYTVAICNQYPDVVIYDDLSYREIPRYANKPCRIAFTGESLGINYERCDLALCFDENNPASYYLPLWVLFIDWFNTKSVSLCKLTDIVARPYIDKCIEKEFFCGFVASNSVPFRDDFVRALSGYKQVTCPGTCLNNYPCIGGRMGREKEFFLRRCKFSIAFENRSQTGYVTEKLLHAFQSRTIPIYWGADTVEQYFNPSAFLNLANFASYDALIIEIIRLDNDPVAYLEMLNQPVFINDFIPKQFWPEKVLNVIEMKIFI